MMKVTVLGTGSIYSKSNSSSLLLDENILVGVGPSVVKYLIRNKYDLLKIDNIILTHLHSDHILDFPTFIVNVDELGLSHKINVYAPKDAKRKILDLLNILYGDWFDKFIDSYFNFIEIFDNFNFRIDDYEFKVKEVKHLGIVSYGFIINNGLGISGDTAMCDGVREIIKHSKVIVTDCSFVKGNDYHMGIDDIKILIDDYPNRNLVLTHFRDQTRDILMKQDLKDVLIVDDGYNLEVE
ncbi:MAG: MBL fold metallo-hydrolase [Bacilli bacterium]|nr:MBL fold metallo-hydrolase [Bacilli bacterium]